MVLQDVPEIIERCLRGISGLLPTVSIGFFYLDHILSLPELSSLADQKKLMNHFCSSYMGHFDA